MGDKGLDISHREDMGQGDYFTSLDLRQRLGSFQCLRSLQMIGTCRALAKPKANGGGHSDDAQKPSAARDWNTDLSTPF